MEVSFSPLVENSSQMATNKLIPLPTHEMFEQMYDPKDPALVLKEPVVIYFTANWCGACKRVDWEFLLEEFPNLKIYKCDVDENKYTPGFCSIRSIPNFVMLGPGVKKASSPFQSSDTAKIATWMAQGIRNSNK